MSELFEMERQGAWARSHGVVCPYCGFRTAAGVSDAQRSGLLKAGKATCAVCTKLMQTVYDPETDTLTSMAVTRI